MLAVMEPNLVKAKVDGSLSYINAKSPKLAFGNGGEAVAKGAVCPAQKMALRAQARGCH